MMDLRVKECLSDKSGDISKCCTDCKTTKTPLWRGGPAGPKTLCNACGIRYRKRRASAVRLHKVLDRKRERAHNSGGGRPADAVTVTVMSTSATATNDNRLRESLGMNMIGWGEEVLLQSVPAVLKKQRCQRRRKLGEVEEAAFCLMALSCGFVFA